MPLETDSLTGELTPAEALTLAWLGVDDESQEHQIAFTMRDDDSGQVYAPVRLPDGREGLWGVSVVGENSFTLDPEGPWLHAGESARLEVQLQEGEPVASNGEVYDFHLEAGPRLVDGFHEIESWVELEGPVEMHTLWAWAEPSEG